jgi:hypothetical protein
VVAGHGERQGDVGQLGQSGGQRDLPGAVDLAHRAEQQVRRAALGRVGGAVGEHADAAPGQPLVHRRDQPGGTGVVGAGDQRAAVEHPVREGLEGRFEGLAGAVVVQVVRLDVGDHGDRRGVREEGSVRLVGLGDEHVPVARAVARHRSVVGAHRAAYRVGRVEHGVLAADRAQGGGDHGRGGGLAVGAGDRDADPVGHQRGQRLGAVQHAQPALARPDQLGVAAADRGGHHEGVDVLDLRGVVTDVHPHPGVAQAVQRGALGGVGAGDGQPARDQQSGHGGHARAADPDQVHPAEVRHRDRRGPGDEGDPLGVGAGRGGGIRRGDRRDGGGGHGGGGGAGGADRHGGGHRGRGTRGHGPGRLGGLAIPGARTLSGVFLRRGDGRHVVVRRVLLRPGGVLPRALRAEVVRPEIARTGLRLGRRTLRLGLLRLRRPLLRGQHLGLHQLLDDVRDPRGGVRHAHRRGGPAHRLPLRRGLGGEQRQQVRGDPVAGEVLVGHQQAAALGDHRLRVEPLLAVADRQRHVDGGDAQGGELADGARAGTAQHEVGEGERLLHLPQVLAHVVALGAGHAAHGGADGLGLAGAGEVQHLRAGGEHLAGLGGDGGVHRDRAEGSAGDQQGDPVGLEAELGGGAAAHALGIGGTLGEQTGDLRAQRQAGDLGARQAGAGEGDRDGGGTPGTEPVGQPGAGVLLVHDHRDGAGAGGQVGGGGHVAAEADHHLRADLVDGVPGGLHGGAQQAGQPEPVGGGAARQRHLGHQQQLDPPLGHQPGLQPFRGAEGDHAQVGVAAPQLLGDGEQRVDVTGRPAAREQHRTGARFEGGGAVGHGVLRVVGPARVARRGRSGVGVRHGSGRSPRASGAPPRAGRPAPRRPPVRCARRR